MRRVPAYAVLLTCGIGGACAVSAVGAVEHSCTGARCAEVTTIAGPAITPAGVGAVRLGRTYRSLRAAGRLGKIRPGCELGGPRTRSARLRAPLKGSVDLTLGARRRVATITVTGGAGARGVGIGASADSIRAAFPRAVFDHGSDEIFGATFVRVPRGGGGRLEFAVDTTTKMVTLIGVPRIATCE